MESVPTATRYIEVEQIGSPIRRHLSQRQTLVGLGLNKIGRIAWVPDTPASRGMLRKVSHLIRINNDPSAPKAPPEIPVYDEADDVALIRKLIFDTNNLALERYEDAALKQGKTPDFKLKKGGEHCGFCELKSPRDDFIFENPNPSGVIIRKNLPFYRKLGSHIRKAAKQFDAKNPEHALPNILVFVTHTPEIERRDLIATIEGLASKDGTLRVPLLPIKMQRQVIDAAHKIDLFLWIDAEKQTCQHLIASTAKHKKAALDLFGLEE